MDVKGALFYIFSAILLYAAFRVVTARNPVYAVLYLVLAFTQAAMVWMLLKAEFLSIALVLVYVGAVMVLFLFVVMMLDINLDALRRGFWRHFPLAATIGALVALEMAAVLTLVGAAILHADHAAGRVAEQDEILAEAAQADRLAARNILRPADRIPEIRDHGFSFTGSP